MNATQNNLLVLRGSPDWATFDLERSRGFLRALRLPEQLVIDFAALWARNFKVDYRDVRARMKAIAVQTFRAVRHASLLRHEDWEGNGPPDGWIAFVDDDDWMAPELFDGLSPPTAAQDGVRWGSLRLGRVFTADGYGVPIIQKRALDRVVYTNNYAVSARAVARLERASLFEHDRAQTSFDRPDFAATASPHYLSCAVKHPCCTMSINYLMSQDDFRSDPRREIAAFMDHLHAMPLDGMDAWLKSPFMQFREVMADAARPR